MIDVNTMDRHQLIWAILEAKGWTKFKSPKQRSGWIIKDDRGFGRGFGKTLEEAEAEFRSQFVADEAEFALTCLAEIQVRSQGSLRIVMFTNAEPKVQVSTFKENHFYRVIGETLQEAIYKMWLMTQPESNFENGSQGGK